MRLVEFTTKSDYRVTIDMDEVDGLIDLSTGITATNTLIKMKSGNSMYVIQEYDFVLALWKDELYQPSTLKEWIAHIEYCDRMGLDCNIPSEITKLINMEV